MAGGSGYSGVVDSSVRPNEGLQGMWLEELDRFSDSLRQSLENKKENII